MRGLQQEVDLAMEPIQFQNRLRWWMHVGGAVVLLGGLVGWGSELGLEGHRLVAATVALAAVWMVGVVSAGLDSVFSAVTMNASISEWIGRKQLGEDADGA